MADARSLGFGQTWPRYDNPGFAAFMTAADITRCGGR
jgi:hypothetical protein